MDIVKTALEWTKAEVFSSTFFILFGVIFIAATIGFWQVGKTEIAKAFIFPSLSAGILLLGLGVGMFLSNKSRLSTIETEYKANPAVFIKSEISRTEKSMGDYQTIAFKVFPTIIVTAALLIIFVNAPVWRAISMTIIAFLIILMLVDSHANERLKTYHEELIVADK